jgi:hypothetical protein
MRGFGFLAFAGGVSPPQLVNLESAVLGSEGLRSALVLAQSL